MLNLIKTPAKIVICIALAVIAIAVIMQCPELTQGFIDGFKK